MRGVLLGWRRGCRSSPRALPEYTGAGWAPAQEYQRLALAETNDLRLGFQRGRGGPCRDQL